MTDAVGRRRGAVVLGALFLALGAVGASWVSRIPSVQDDLGLSPGVLGLTLLGVPVGSVGASLLLPRLLRGDGRAVVAVASPLAALSLIPAGWSAGPATLALSLTAFGAATGALDVALNTYGVALERALGRSVFARLHAMWSLGAFVGAGVGAGFAALGWSPGGHFAVVAGAVLVLSVVLVSRLPHLATAPARDAPRAGWTVDRGVLVLAAAAVAALVVEVTAADWGGVFVRHELAAGSTTASAAFAVFTLLHFVVRVAGDRVIDRVRRRRLLVAGLAGAAAGMAVVAVSPSVWVAFVGLAAAGASVALVFPVAVAGAGQVAGVLAGAGVATAAGTAYVGWSVTPAAVGGIASVAGLRVALLLPVAASVAAVMLLRPRRVQAATV
ncbi:MAG TPA: MFS transporter [Mycobacteriales bacterium]|nr:MFS transporter [Mycobacteriales bacterium]